LESTSRFIPSASPFSSRFTSSFTYQLISVIIPTLVIHHSFTLSLQAQNLPFQQILPTVDFFYLLDCLRITGLDRTYHAHHLNFHILIFLFIPCGRLDWCSSAFYCTLNTHYRIVSYSEIKRDIGRNVVSYRIVQCVHEKQSRLLFSIASLNCSSTLISDTAI